MWKLSANANEAGKRRGKRTTGAFDWGVQAQMKQLTERGEVRAPSGGGVRRHGTA